MFKALALTGEKEPAKATWNKGCRRGRYQAQDPSFLGEQQTTHSELHPNNAFWSMVSIEHWPQINSLITQIILEHYKDSEHRSSFHHASYSMYALYRYSCVPVHGSITLYAATSGNLVHHGPRITTRSGLLAYPSWLYNCVRRHLDSSIA